MEWALRVQGVGNASAVALGSPMATLERGGAPWLTIDCGSEGLTSYQAHYGQMPQAVFITHVHLDHVGGLERLFVDSYFSERRGRTRLYVPAPVVPLLQRRLADYPNVLAEGGANFWDAFQLVPVGEAFWHDGVRLEVFPVRHHWPETAYGCACRVRWSGPATPGRSRRCWRAMPMTASSSRMTAAFTATRRILVWMTWSGNTRRTC